MAGFLQRGILLYLFLAIAITFAAPQIVFEQVGGTPAGSTVLSWFDMTYDFTTDTVVVNGDSFGSPITNSNTNAFTTQTPPAGIGTSNVGFIDPIFQVFSWIPLFFTVLFSPIILFTAGSVPGVVILIVAVPLVLLMVVGLLGFIRGGQI